MRIAIVGSGISGLVAAHHLHREHDITVFEANDYIGGHTHTVTVQDNGRPLQVDTGFIVFNERNYPRFSRLLSELGVNSHESNMSFGVNCERSGLEYRASSLGTLFAQKRNLVRPPIYTMIRDIFRFFRHAPALLEAGAEDVTLGEYLERGGYSEVFVEKHILPMGAALWSATRDDIREFPARFFVQFLDNHGMLARSGRPTWRVVSGGSSQYVDAITAPFRHRIRLRTPVTAIERDDMGVTLVHSDDRSERFDHVIISVHSDQALRMVAAPTSLEREVLGSIPYQRNEVVLHTDTSILPRSRKAWAAWNHHILDTGQQEVAVTYWMNLLQGFSASNEYLVTLNASDRIDRRAVLAEFVYHHPVLTRAGVSRQSRQLELGRGLHTTYCGAYWGFGFHEDGVASAEAAVEEVRAAAEAKTFRGQDVGSAFALIGEDASHVEVSAVDPDGSARGTAGVLS